MNPLWHIACVILVSGMLGGIINYFIEDAQTEQRLAWWKLMFVGVGAAFMVPLFLNMISGDLIDKIRGVAGQPPDYSKMFVLAGFCLVAAISSRSFIRTLSERVLQEVRSAKKQAQSAEELAASAKAAVAPLIEEDEPGDSPTTRLQDKATADALTAAEKSVLSTLTNSSLVLRSISGIAKECSMEHEQAAETINLLIAKKLAGQTTNQDGKLRWFATSEGRIVAAHG